MRTLGREADSQDRTDLSQHIALYSISSATVLSGATNKGAPIEIRALGNSPQLFHMGEGPLLCDPGRKSKCGFHNNLVLQFGIKNRKFGARVKFFAFLKRFLIVSHIL